MKKTILAVLALIIVIPYSGWAATNIILKEAGLMFTLPDTWDATGIRNQSAPKMDSTDPLMIRWKRSPVVDKSGNSVSPGLNIVVFAVPSDTNLVLYSNSLMGRRKWPFKAFLTADKDGLMLPHSMGYLTQYSPRHDLVMKVFVVHLINNGVFAEFILSATEEVFPQVEPEFRAIIRSLHLVGNEHAGNNTSTGVANSYDNKIMISEIRLSFKLPQTWPNHFNIVHGSPSSMPSASPFTINMRRNSGGNAPGTFSVISITMFDLTRLDRYGSLFQNGKLIGTEMYCDYLKMPNREDIEFRELDDASNALLYGRYILSLNHAPADKTLPNIHIPNSIGFIGARRIGNVPYTTYEIYEVNKDRMGIIVIGVPTSSFWEMRPEMDEISQGITYNQ